MNLNKECMRGLDLSHWNELDYTHWDYIATHFDFVMLKYGGEEVQPGYINLDKRFNEYYTQAKSRGLKVGCYFFISNDTVALKGDPRPIAQKLADQLKGYCFEMPVALDVENDSRRGLDKVLNEELTTYVRGWCECMEENKYYVAIYGSDVSTFMEHLNVEELDGFDKWVARYGKRPECVTEFGIWQYTSELPFFDMKVDADISYKYYPDIIRKAGLNNIMNIDVMPDDDVDNQVTEWKYFKQLFLDSATKILDELSKLIDTIKEEI